MAFTYVTVQDTYETANDQPARGTVTFTPVDQMVNGPTVIAGPNVATLDTSGAISIRLAATTDPATKPAGVTYKVVEQIAGQATRTYYVSVPHDQGSTLNLADLTVIAGGGGGSTPIDTVQVVPYAASVTIDAAQAGTFRVVATGDLTVADVIHGVDGQTITLEVNASGGARTLTIGSWSLTISSGQWWVGVLRYVASTTTWLLDDSSGGTVVSVDGTTVSTLDIDSTAVTAADVGAVATTGGTIAGDLTVRDASSTKGYRFVTAGSGVPLYYAVTGENLVFRTNSGATFNGTSRDYIRLSKDTQEIQLAGEVQFRDALGGTTIHDINPVDGVAALGAKNGLTNLRFCGFRNASGAPTSGTWAVGDLVLDSTKTWRLCTVAGTPGTWI